MKFIFLLSSFLISAVFVLTNVYGDAMSPIQQIKAGILPSEIVCNNDLLRMTDSAKNRYACVRESSVDAFVKKGWQEVPGRPFQELETQDGIKTISTTKIESIGVKKSTTSVYDHVFEVCAGSVTLVAPEVLIKSDVETKTVQMSSDVPANSCLISTATIIAIESNSIKSELTNQDDIVSRISLVKAEIEGLTLQLESERQNFSTVLAEPSSDAKKQKMDESISKISQLRQTIAGLKDDLNRYYLVLYGAPKAPAAQQTKTSFSGAEITGNSVKILSLTPARTEGTFDVVLEVCAGQTTISDPIIALSSDTKQRTLKLNKVIANSCYKTGAKIDATSQDSVSAKFAESASSIMSIEQLIKNMEGQINQKRAELADLTHNTTSPDPKKIHQITEEMTSLRAEIVTAKSMLYQSLYKAYKAE